MHPYFPFLMHSYLPKIKHICFPVTLIYVFGRINLILLLKLYRYLLKIVHA